MSYFKRSFKCFIRWHEKNKKKKSVVFISDRKSGPIKLFWTDGIQVEVKKGQLCIFNYVDVVKMTC